MQIKTTAPPETKVVAGGTVYIALAAIAQVFAQYAPGIHLPSTGTLTILFGMIATIIAYFAPHTPRPEEVTKAAVAMVRSIDEGNRMANLANYRAAATNAPTTVAAGLVAPDEQPLR